MNDLRSAMSVLQREFVAERRKWKYFRDQIERFKIDVQENGFEARLEKSMVDVQRSVAEACDECRRYERKFADRRLRGEWRGRKCGCARTVPGDLEEQTWTMDTGRDAEGVIA